jgi:hypothetical protein
MPQTLQQNAPQKQQKLQKPKCDTRFHGQSQPPWLAKPEPDGVTMSEKLENELRDLEQRATEITAAKIQKLPAIAQTTNTTKGNCDTRLGRTKPAVVAGESPNSKGVTNDR